MEDLSTPASRARQSLEASKRLSDITGYKKHSSSHSLMATIAALPLSDFQPLTVKSQRTTIFALAMLLARHWAPTSLCAFPPAQKIEEECDISRATRRRATEALRELGFFGVIEGKQGSGRNNASTYYPLWDLASRNAFKAKVLELEAFENSMRTLSKMEPMPVSDESEVPF